MFFAGSKSQVLFKQLTRYWTNTPLSDGTEKACRARDNEEKQKKKEQEIHQRSISFLYTTPTLP
jgi:hypothetical protein